ncbi:hypothetical protein PV04_03294 [Phialophora macrospora]|uniref:5'-3' DNA helicase ZGRF1-like N-terminal domain-containing protein n=1 Tax=Phialophora macrospora TaxID=1851006 RepID=A0A0D2D0V5_9EURO|nr:hypothetical protein PV04_03294 [Phialophora macrospora]
MPALTSSLAVTASQTTAPVHEFRCLYTRDLHKKSKKWHDGSVRFHTFNRRVMVYDDSRTFIDDVHYRQEEEFAEGIEIRLDRGVLVEVGERLGQTQTDLAPILDRQRPERGPSPRKQPVSLSNRLQSTGPSQRPKSLTEVLGPSQGRLGRARIPYQSPYEQRYPSTRRDPGEPSPKRPRLSSDKENRADEGPARLSLPQPMRPSKPIPQPSRRAEPPIEFEEVFDLSANEEEPQRHPPERVRLTAKSGRNRKEAPEKPPLTPVFSYPGPTALPRPDHCAVRAGKGKDSRKKPKPSSNSNESATRTHPINSRSSATRTARLLLSRPKPRQKLTCILPFSSGPSIAGPLERSLRPLSCRQSASRSPLSGGKARHFYTDDQTIADELSPPNQFLGSQSSTREQEVSLHHDTSSPLFIPEDNVDPKSSPPALLLTQDEFPFPDVEHSETFDDVGEVGISPNRAETEGENGPAEQNGSENQLEPEPPCEPGSPPTAQPEDHVRSRSWQNSEEATTVQKENKPKPHRGSETDDPIEVGERTEPEMAIVQEKKADSETRPAPTSLVMPERQTGAGKERENHEQAESQRKTHRDPQLPINNVLQPLTTRPENRVEVQNQPPLSMVHSASLDGRSFRRVFSENDALNEDYPPPVPPANVSNSRRPLGLLENLSNRRSSAKSRSPSKVQRCSSDTLKLDAADRYVSRPVEDGSRELTGPWTVEEAFLLFDWWPAEIERPGYWTDTTVEPVSRALREPAYGNWGGITTARQFLRDDVNV